jgi:anti-sigma factor RsiW
MDCNETRRLLEADIDGELDLVRHLELEAHLRGCPQCAKIAENARARSKAIRDSVPRYSAPAGLAAKIRVALPDAAPARQERPKMVFPLWQLAGLAASVAVAGLFGFAWGSAHSHTSLVEDEAVSEHIRSLEVNHLTDVVSTDQHTVKPWFSGKLDFSPPVVDLASSGFPLAGGRLDHIDGRPAAALVFHRRQHAINLFIWPSATETGIRTSDRIGYHTVSWSQGGLSYLAVSEIPASELAGFVAAFREGTR